MRTFKELRRYEKLEDSVADVFEQTVARNPEKVCFQFEEQMWTFKEVRLRQFVQNGHSSPVL